MKERIDLVLFLFGIGDIVMLFITLVGLGTYRNLPDNDDRKEVIKQYGGRFFWLLVIVLLLLGLLYIIIG